MSIQIRVAQASDFSRIVSIYNQAIMNRGQTADLEPVTEAERKDWFEEHLSEQYPILVAVEDTLVIGWISLSPYRKGRKALDTCAEISLYIDNAFKGRGVGSDMMACMIALARDQGIHNLLAFVIADNEQSKGLFAKYKFELWGELPQVVMYDDVVANHCIYGRSLLR